MVEHDLVYLANGAEFRLNRVDCLKNIVYHVIDKLEKYDKSIPKEHESDISMIGVSINDLCLAMDMIDDETCEIHKEIIRIRKNNHTLFNQGGVR